MTTHSLQSVRTEYKGGPCRIAFKSRAILAAFTQIYRFTLRLLLFTILALVSATDTFSQSPNILWITAEDMSPTLGCFGDTYATTPNIDDLAQQSVTYTNAFATAPVCSPSRSCLITGCYAPSLGTHHMRSAQKIPDFIHGFPSYLRKAGYYTSNNVKTDYNTADAARLIKESWDESSDAAHWRNRKDETQPFFSVFNIMTSHQSRSMVWSQERFRDEVQSKLTPSQVHDPENAPVPSYYPDNMVTRRIVARYYDCVTAMDKRVGEILRQLKDDGLEEDTIVFFYSDHGSGMPRHKRLLHDSGMHVPLIIRFPRKYGHLAPRRKGTTVDQLVSFVDFPPTVLALAGIDAPDYMQGQSFLGKGSTKRQYVFGHRDRIDEVFDLGRSVRNKRYLYIRNYMPHLSHNQFSSYSDLSEIRHELYRIAARDAIEPMSSAQRQYAGPAKPTDELYDCIADPDNTNNLASTAEFRQELLKMRTALDRHIEESHDLGFVPESYSAGLYKDTTQWEAARLGEGDAKHHKAFEARRDLAFPTNDAVVDDLRSDDASTRYWAAMSVRSFAQKEVSDELIRELKLATNDDIPAVRIEAASTLCRLGYINDALSTMVKALEDEDLNVVLHATRAIELLGKRAQSAEAAMKAVAARTDKLQAETTGAVFVQTGEQDLAMFCSFSAHGFLTRLKQGEWQELIASDTSSSWKNTTGDVRFGASEVAMDSAGKNLWIVHDDEFDDFELTAEVKMPFDDYNAGIGFRIRDKENGKIEGYQCEVAEELSGMLYAIGSGGWVWPKTDEQKSQFFDKVGAAFQQGRWNHFRVICQGDHIRIWVNGIKATDIRDKRHVKGSIALQHHGKGGTHRYRNVRIRTLQ